MMKSAHLLSPLLATAALVAVSAPTGRVFRPERYSRGDTNVRRLQPLDDAGWLKVPSAFCRFRREFDATGGVARIDVSADERFVLVLDGRIVARGPNRGDVSNWQYQSYDLAFASGRHRLDAVVWRIGEAAPLAQISWGGGFALKAEGAFDGLLTTGKADWRVGTLTGTVPDPSQETAGAWGVGSTFRVTGTGVTTEEPQSWQAAEIVREALPPAEKTLYGGGGRMEGWMPYPSQIEDQLERMCRPGSFKVSPCGTSFRPFEVPAHSRVELLWDMENYYCAYPVLKTAGGSGARILWGWAESMREPDGKGHKCWSRKDWEGKLFRGFTDLFVSDGRGDAVFTTPWWRCGRWCKLTVETADVPLAVKDIAVVETRYPVEDEGEFSCDDATLTPIRRICARGMQMCAHEMLFDCPFYEQQMYPGDSRVQLRVLAGMSDDDRLIRRAIEIYDYGRRDNGTIPMNWPSRGLQESATYSMCQVMMYADYVRCHSNAAWLAARLPGMRHTLDGLSRFENAEGLLEGLPGWSFMDWVPGWPKGVSPDGHARPANAVNNLYWVLTLRGAASVERAMGEPARADVWERKAARTMASVERLFWDERRGLYADTVRHDAYSEHAQCLAILSGALTREKAERVFASLLSADDLARCTVYFSYYLFETYFAFGRGDLFLKRLDLWRDYVARDLKTPLEAPDCGKNGQDEARSDCHAWGSHPLVWMQRGLAGIDSAAPFYRRVRVAPAPGGLKFIRAKSPHPDGFVEVDLAFRDGVASGTVTLPPGVDGEFVWNGEVLPLHAGTNAVRTEKVKDVLVLGGTLAAVRAALAAKASGKDVTVYAPRPYLGEDRAGTYDLRRHADDDPDDPLVREIFNSAYGASDAYAVKWGTRGWHACERIEPFANRTGAVPASAGLADVTTPFLVKRALDRALLKAGVKFVTGAVVIEVRERAVRLATRAGVRTVSADEIVDCRIPGPSVPGDYVYAWNVVRGRTHPRVETVETRVRLDSVSPRALASAERQARDRLFAPDLLDVAPFPTIRPVGKASAPRRGPRAPARLSADVVVVGGGTGGAPAAIAAARRGAKVAVVEFLNVLGGVTTEGRICGYYHGNICGFTEEVDSGMADLGGEPWIAKGEWYRRELGRLGADVLFGAFGYGVVKSGNRVTGVRVAFPDGSTCVISCKVVIDATGNCDIAAAAGCETDFISADELSLQGAGVAPQPLGVSGLNADVGFVDETSVEDISGFLLRARLSLPDRIWNVSQMTDSRERRRLVGVIRLMPSDILAGRTYRDTICETISNFDTHGQTASDVFFVRSPGKRGDVHRAQVPYRCLLPKDVDGLLVTGLGVSAHRDAMPVLRMQPDIQNVGYAAGVAAAQAAERDVSPRQIDVKDLQCRLIAVGNVESHVLTDADSPRTDEAVFRPEDCASFLSRLKTSDWDEGWDFKGMSQFGRSVSDVDMLLIALGKCRYAAAADEIVRKAGSLTAADAYSHFRAIALAAEGCATDRTRQPLAKALHRLLALPGVGGHVRVKPEPIPGFADAAADRERTLVLRELALARALHAVGDCGSLGHRTLCGYLRDYRRAYAAHARMVMDKMQP